MKFLRKEFEVNIHNIRVSLLFSKNYKTITQIDNDGHTKTTRYQYDNLPIPIGIGSASLELDDQGGFISYEEYHPFGTTSYRSGKNKAEVSLKRYKYVGKERDEETGLYYYGARYYSGWLGRFVSVDPLATERQWLNPYNYVQDNPINRIDVKGMTDDHWEIDKKNGENPILVDTKGDEIFINNTPINKFQFDTQEKWDALSQIATYYNGKSSDNSRLYNSKISIISYTGSGNRVTGESNWELIDKPYEYESLPVAFAYSKTTYNLKFDRLTIPVGDGTVSNRLDTKWNFINSLVHENVHLDQSIQTPEDYKTYSPYYELEAYLVQMTHDSWEKTTIDFQSRMLDNAEGELGKIKGSKDKSTQKMFNMYKGKLNTIKKNIQRRKDEIDKPKEK